MEIPFVNLRADHLEIMDSLKKVVLDTMDSNFFVLGPRLAQFEKNFAKFCQSNFCAGVGSGLDALVMILRAFNIKQDDEVILPANTFIATAEAVSLVGAVPRLVDIEEESFNISYKKTKEAITKKTKAIIVVHLYGRPVDLNYFKEFQGIRVFEDFAQAHGARVRGSSAGSLGVANATSFYPVKSLGAFGDGGAVTTNEEKIYDKICQLRNYGQTKKYHHETKGMNSRLDELQAAILDFKLTKLEEANQKRRKIAAYYRKGLQDVPNLIVPGESKDGYHVYHQFVIRVPSRDNVQKMLRDRQIQTMIHYPIPIHLQKAYEDLGYEKGKFPVSERAADEILSLPIYPSLRYSQLDYVIENLKDILAHSVIGS